MAANTSEAEIERLHIVIDSYAASSAAAAREINLLREDVSRLRGMIRLQDAVIRSHEIACLTHEEREAVQWAANHLDNCGFSSATLRGLLERDQRELRHSADKAARERELNEKGLGSEPD